MERSNDRNLNWSGEHIGKWEEDNVDVAYDVTKVRITFFKIQNWWNAGSHMFWSLQRIMVVTGGLGLDYQWVMDDPSGGDLRGTQWMSKGPAVIKHY